MSDSASTPASAVPSKPVIFPLVLHRTYYSQGFFSVTVDFDGYLPPDERKITLALEGGPTITARVNRKANTNRTARILGGASLRQWFQSNFEPLDRVHVDFSSPDQLVLRRPRTTATTL